MDNDGSISEICFIHGLMKKEVEELLRFASAAKRHLPETGTPVLDAVIRKNEIIITVELPGLSADDFTVYIYDNLLVMEGIRKRYSTDQRFLFIRAEREFTPFKRVMQLPFPVDHTDTKAVLKNGVLTITLKKSEK